MDDKGDEIIPSSVVSMVPSTAVDKSVAKEALDNCRTISNMLKAAHKYKEQAEKFIRLEAQTYVDCANLRGRLPKGTKTEDRRIIEWLETMSGQEQLGVIDKCAENSMSIRALYKRLQSASEAWKSEYKDFSHDERVDRKSIVNKLLTVGIVDLKSEYKDKYNDRATNDAFKNRAKDMLLKHGGICFGDGVYIKPDVCMTMSDAEKQSAIAKALLIRVKSINNDCIQAAKLLCELGRNRQTKTVDETFKQLKEYGAFSVIQIMASNICKPPYDWSEF